MRARMFGDDGDGHDGFFEQVRRGGAHAADARIRGAGVVTGLA
ncbi:MAG: hypothetical protein OD918_08405 [Gammaproteobacteria bacterium]